MNLSKIYRGDETNDLREFQFRSFGERATDSPAEADEFVKKSVIAIPEVAPKTAPTASASTTAIEEAYRRGKQKGLDTVENNLDAAAQALAAAATEISRLRESLAKNSSQDMLRLVMAVAEQIIRREVAADPKVVLTIIETALQSSVRADQYRIQINPADFDNVVQQKPLFLASISGLKNLSIEADTSVSAGGCRIDSELGDVDATIETQLEAIRQALDAAITDSG
ncbi:MAG: flagellar assembly protein FliH [Thermodesulfobacteriota bacterium]|nr:flagellar assembly protein FliH [Thermodesulfobacteriota bacterium]